MNIVTPSVIFRGIVPTEKEQVIPFIEGAGRLCYKSEEKITDTSALPFVKRLISSGHLAMVEHSNFVIRRFRTPGRKYDVRPYLRHGSFLTFHYDGNYDYIGGNLTAWFYYVTSIEASLYLHPFMKPFIDEYGKLFNVELQFKCDIHMDGWEICPTEEIPNKLKFASFQIVTDRGITHEIVRHRPASYAQESTRYCNYSQDKFEKSCSFIMPPGLDVISKRTWIKSCEDAEEAYFDLLARGNSPQIARAVLPNCLKTEIIMTASLQEFKHFIRLRSSKVAHPQIIPIALQIHSVLFGLFRNLFKDLITE